MGSCHRHPGVGVFVCLAIVAGAIVVSVSVFFGRCGPAGTPGLPAGRLKVIMARTPSPSEPLKKASLTITRVEVLRDRTVRRPLENAGLLGLPQRAVPAHHSWIVVQEGEQIVNLLEIHAGRANLLINADLPQGRYTSLRLTCREGRVTLDGPDDEAPDETFVLDAHRAKAREVTLNCDFLVAPGRETTLLLNIDVNRAFQPIRAEKEEKTIFEGFRFSPCSAMRLVNLLSADPSMNTEGLLVESDDQDPT